MTCGDANELVAFAERRLSGTRMEAVAQHLDGCAACRAVIASLARSIASEPASVMPSLSEEPPPAELVQQYLRRDAADRELAISRFWLVVVAIGLLLLLPPLWLGEGRFVAVAIAIQVAFFGYELVVMRRIRRGRFSVRLPLANTLVEAAMFSAMNVAVATTLESALVGGHPGYILRGALIAITAIRLEPRLCVIAGAAAAVDAIAIGAYHAELAALAPALAVPAGFLLLAGFGGWILARYFLAAATRALAEIRAQDLHAKYILGAPLGRGGMGEVFRATYCPDGNFVRQVALKRLRADVSGDPKFEEAFRREVRLGASLSHPNLVQLLDCGRFHGTFVVAMELVDGISLRDLLHASGPLPPALVAYIGSELALALAYVHAKHDDAGRALDLVHCDVNPPNVLVSRTGQVKLGDFGVARATATTARPVGFGGKREYAAPEQLAGGPLDGRTDLYGLGVTLREALAPDPPAPALARIIAALCAPNADDRPGAATDVHAALSSLTGDLAPYPRGAARLAVLVERALGAEVAPSEPSTVREVAG